MNAQLAAARARAAKIQAAAWSALPAVKGSIACLTCGCGAREDIDGGRWIAVGFGNAGITKNGKHVWSEDELPRDGAGLPHEDSPEPLTMADAERLAAEDPEADWRVYFFAPLYEATYQRQGPGRWVLIESGEGFA
jgi:hypothetical protein